MPPIPKQKYLNTLNKIKNPQDRLIYVYNLTRCQLLNGKTFLLLLKEAKKPYKTNEASEETMG